jgi:hypothetical protein
MLYIVPKRDQSPRQRASNPATIACDTLHHRFVRFQRSMRVVSPPNDVASSWMTFNTSSSPFVSTFVTAGEGEILTGRDDLDLNSLRLASGLVMLTTLTKTPRLMMRTGFKRRRLLVYGFQRPLVLL